jgi:hypothetical protein
MIGSVQLRLPRSGEKICAMLVINQAGDEFRDDQTQLLDRRHQWQASVSGGLLRPEKWFRPAEDLFHRP